MTTLNKAKRKKRNTLRCNSCMEYTCSTEAALVAHARKEHPESAYACCWDAFGSLGDPFADAAMRELDEKLRVRIKRLEEKVAELEPSANAYAGLLPRWNALCRALHIGNLAMDEYRQAYEKSKP